MERTLKSRRLQQARRRVVIIGGGVPRCEVRVGHV